jgi:hypothetical protein
MTLIRRVAALLVGSALVGGARLASQAVERTDVPGSGVLRVTFDPRIMTWNSVFTDLGRLGLGRGLTGDSVGAAYIPAVAQLQRDVRFASGVAGFVASLGQGVLSVRQERRCYPVSAELGLSQRLSLRLMVPIVRVGVRTGLQLSPQGSTLGVNPKLSDATAAGRYQTFFQQFGAALAQLDSNIAHGVYPGCGGPCPARDSSSYWHQVRDALARAVNGVPFLPRDSSDGGKGITATLTTIESDMAKFSVAFTGTLQLPSAPVDYGGMVSAVCPACSLQPDSLGFGYHGFPFRNSFRYNLGDAELGAKYRFVAGARYAAAALALVRLPTGAKDSADDWLRPSIGDHLWGFEGQIQQEVMVGPLWLNVAVRGGIQLAGTRVVRAAAWDALFVPVAATTALRWQPGRYVGVDVAPLIRLAPEFAAGVTAAYWTKARDHYSFASPQDSVALATRLGVPTPASIVNAGTSERALRLGFALTYAGPRVEGGFSIEQTVTGAGVVPAATLFRIVMRVSRQLF